jgi:two-component system chemotaxis response regulator CheB
MSKIEVREAVNGDCISKNTAYIAPGGKQMKIIFKNGQLKVEITDDPPVNRFKPSVDYMFNSIAELPVAKKSKVALLTGMGDDGAKGMLKLRNLGALTIAQSEESCVVYGMPKVAVEIKAAQKILDLSEISYHLLKKAS